MPITVICRNCFARSTAPDAAAGKHAKCPKCGNPLTVPEPIPSAPLIPAYEVVEDDMNTVAPTMLPQPPQRNLPRGRPIPFKHTPLTDQEKDSRGNRMACLKVKIWVSPLAIFARVCAPVVEIDKVPFRCSWGTHYFDVPAGRHRIRIYFPYMFMPECGANEIDVELHEGETTRIQFLMPPVMLMKGAIREL